MSALNKKCLRIIRYGTAAEQEFLAGEYKTIYDQIVINANMVAHTRASISKFLAEKCNGKPFFIDPLTHAFQHDLSMIESSPSEENDEKLKIKKSFLKLIESYGDPIKTAILDERRPLSPQDFKSSKKIRAFSKRVIEFQETYLSTVKEKADTAKYYMFLKKKKIEVNLEKKPTITIAPYFYLSVNTMDWLNVNVSLAESSLDLVNKSRLAVQLVIHNKVLMNKKLRENVIEAYKKIDCSWCLVWIDGFVEKEASEEELTTFIDFINELGKTKKIINLYGSFFSVCCARTGITPNLHAVAHGMEYGESRAVIPVGGGIPVAKFYLPALFCRLHFRDAVRAIRKLDGFKDRDSFLEKICNCEECKQTIKSDDIETDFDSYGKTKTLKYRKGLTFISREFPTTDTKKKCLRHYLLTRTSEYNDAKYSDLFKVINLLSKKNTELNGGLSLETISHCSVWKNVFSKYANKN